MYPVHTTIETITRQNMLLGRGTIAVMETGGINDVACYYMHIDNHQRIEPSEVTRSGFKMSEERAINFGFTIPDGYHYRG